MTYLELTKRTYRAEGSPDPVTARRVAVELGVGCKVQLQTQDGNKVVGRIVTFDKEQLNLDLGGKGPANIPYAQIQELKPKRVSVAKVGFAVGGAVGVAALVSLIVIGSSD